MHNDEELSHNNEKYSMHTMFVYMLERNRDTRQVSRGLILSTDGTKSRGITICEGTEKNLGFALDKTNIRCKGILSLSDSQNFQRQDSVDDAHQRQCLRILFLILFNYMLIFF
jgi:hypothetical protein